MREEERERYCNQPNKDDHFQERQIFSKENKIEFLFSVVWEEIYEVITPLWVWGKRELGFRIYSHLKTNITVTSILQAFLWCIQSNADILGMSHSIQTFKTFFWSNIIQQPLLRAWEPT